jgi:hypothetical protein
VPLSKRWLDLGMKHEELLWLFRSFNAYADPFRKESEAHEK